MKNEYIIGLIGLWFSIIPCCFIFYIMLKAGETGGIITLDFNHFGEYLAEFSGILVICLALLILQFMLIHEKKVKMEKKFKKLFEKIILQEEEKEC
jgi:hypothetical protein